jgi:hypothetical protein
MDLMDKNKYYSPEEIKNLEEDKKLADFIKRGLKTERIVRICVRCKGKFISKSRFNRLCYACKEYAKTIDNDTYSVSL